MATLDEQKQLIRLLQEEEKLRIKIERLKGETISKLEQEARLIAVQAEEQEKLIDLLSLEEDARTSALASEEAILVRQKRRGEISGATYEAATKALDEIADIERGTEQVILKQLKAKQELLKQQLKNNAAIRDGANAAEQIADSIARAVGFGPGLTRNILDAVKAGGSFKDIFDKAGKSIKENFSQGGVLAFVLTNTAQVLKQFDTLIADVASATGQGRSFASIIEESFDATTEFGTSLQEAADSLVSLQMSFAGFRVLNNAARTELNETAILLERLGVGGDQLGNRLNYLTFALGMSTGEALEFNKGLARLAIGLEVPPNIIANQYTALIPKLALFRDGGTKAFTDVAQAAAQMGLDVNNGAQSLFDLSEGFMDFESAADKVASINVVLGGSFVNAFDMVMAAAKGPVEQVKLLQDAFSSAGKSLDDMPFFEKRFLAQSLGISFDNLTKIINGEIDANEKLLSTEEQMLEATKATADMMSKFMASIQSLTVTLTPLIEALTPIVEVFGAFIRYGGDLILIAYGLSFAFSAITAKLGALVLAATLAGGVLQAKLALGFVAVGIALGGVMVGFMAFRKLTSLFGEESGKIAAGALAIAFGIGAIAIASTAGLAALPMIAALGGLAAGLGAGALGAFDTDKGPKKKMGALDKFRSSADYSAGFEEAEMPTVFSRRQFGGFIPPGATVQVDPGEQVFAKAPKGGAEVISQKDVRIANKISQSGLAGAALVPVLAKQVEKLTKAVIQQQQQQPAPQPLEVIMQVDGRKMSRTVVENINRDFGTRTDSRVPMETGAA